MGTKGIPARAAVGVVLRQGWLGSSLIQPSTELNCEPTSALCATSWKQVTQLFRRRSRVDDENGLCQRVRDSAMLYGLSKQIAHCYLRADECKKLSVLSVSASDKQFYIAREQAWLTLARSYELQERIAQMVKELRTRVCPPPPTKYLDGNEAATMSRLRC
jgi:hypothetical protein